MDIRMGAKIAPFWYPRWPPQQSFLKFIKWHLIPNRKLHWSESWWEAQERYRNSESLKSLCSNNQDGGHSGFLKIFKPHLLLSGIELKLSGATWRFRIAQSVLLRYPRWLPLKPSSTENILKIFNCYLTWSFASDQLITRPVVFRLSVRR